MKAAAAGEDVRPPDAGPRYGDRRGRSPTRAAHVGAPDCGEHVWRPPTGLAIAVTHRRRSPRRSASTIDVNLGLVLFSTNVVGAPRQPSPRGAASFP